MDWCSLLCWVPVVVILIQFVRLIFADGDLSLMWKERFGKTPDCLRGQVVWIVGASGGIGEYLAYELAKAKCRLIISARRVQDLERVREACLALGTVASQDVLVLPLDVLAMDQHQDALDKVISKFGHIDILVNNAGRSQTALIKNSPTEVDRRIMELNFFAIMSLTKIVLPCMTQRGQGHVVVTCSLAGIVGVPMSASYSASKFALKGWFDALRIELYADNITVTLLCPGPVQSDLQKAALGDRVDQPHGTANQDQGTETKMSTARCAQLITVAMANKMDEVWISPNPILIFTYLFQYGPATVKRLATKFGFKATTSTGTKKTE